MMTEKDRRFKLVCEFIFAIYGNDCDRDYFLSERAAQEVVTAADRVYRQWLKFESKNYPPLPIDENEL